MTKTKTTNKHWFRSLETIKQTSSNNNRADFRRTLRDNCYGSGAIEPIDYSCAYSGNTQALNAPGNFARASIR